MFVCILYRQLKLYFNPTLVLHARVGKVIQKRKKKKKETVEIKNFFF